MFVFTKFIPFGIFVASGAPPTATGRFLEFETDPAVLDSMDFMTRQLLLDQDATDRANAQYAFDLNGEFPSSVATSIGPIGLNMTSKSHVSSDSVTFLSSDHPNYYVTFTHNCKIDDDSLVATRMVPHPLLKEFWMGKVASHAGLSIWFVYVSPPVALTAGIFPSLSQEQVDQCQSVGASIRFIVVHKPPTLTLREHLAVQPSSRYPPKIAFAIGAHLLSMTRRLHAFGIAHGTLGLDDISISVARDGTPSLLLFNNFASPRTTWIDRESGLSLSRFIPAPAPGYEHLQSPWELADGERHHYGIRDDVYRVVQLVSTMLNGIGHTEELSTLAKNGFSLLEHKLTTPVLHVAPAANLIRILPISQDNKARISSSMMNISARVILEPEQVDPIQLIEIARLVTPGKVRVGRFPRSTARGVRAGLPRNISLAAIPEGQPAVVQASSVSDPSQNTDVPASVPIDLPDLIPIEDTTISAKNYPINQTLVQEEDESGTTSGPIKRFTYLHWRQ